jgi:hypothetical protein
LFLDIMAVDSSYTSLLISELGLENQMSEDDPPTASIQVLGYNPSQVIQLGSALSVRPRLPKEVSGSDPPEFPGILNDAVGSAVFPQLVSGEDSVHAPADIAGQQR